MIPNPSKSSKSALLRRLRTAVGKVRFLLRNHTPQFSSVNTWRIISNLRSSTGLLRGKPPRHLSFNDRRPSGLIEICDDTAEYSPLRKSDSYASVSTDSTPGRVLHRTTSVPESLRSGSAGEEDEEDVDRKADVFIDNFYKQLRLDKQISLELRYRRDYSFGSNYDPSP
ncbi:hypothetical protein V2J09_010251 [Rumex salicifolius]